MLDSTLYQVTGDDQPRREQPQLRRQFDDLRPALDLPACLFEKAHKRPWPLWRLIATLRNPKKLS
jgi:hypothetical protein